MGFQINSTTNGIEYGLNVFTHNINFQYFQIKNQTNQKQIEQTGSRIITNNIGIYIQAKGMLTLYSHTFIRC